MMRHRWEKSPVTRVTFRGQHVHVKRDDVFHLTGNKMRKLYYFVKQSDAFYTNAHFYSYGGSQSNAMLALAQLAHARHVPFTYFSRSLQLKEDDAKGNLSRAKSLGMRHVQLEPETYKKLIQRRHFASFVEETLRPCPGTRSLYVPQGAACPEAKVGVQVLANEINDYVETHWPDKHFSVVIPCGTGTTALYLAQYLQPETQLFAIPCVGDATYLTQQFKQLIIDDPSLDLHTAKMPQLLHPKRKNRFGRLWWPLCDMYHEVLQETQVEIDLVYGAFAWHTLFSDEKILDEVLKGRNHLSTASTKHDEDVRKLLYVHTGGTSGNASMLARYARKNKL
ncbi:hypothetical protein PsorP6_000964 [Peronosclerospora sorghi]|uniref:Uncharacterized protein n=1 Tax=Peronosclerospora sorghi TaxID=230839 RepID=A0ACC0WQD5_9STRA|nr:hypothetical protein PsorP6_000964 [Peronosclerospora sorghi]